MEKEMNKVLINLNNLNFLQTNHTSFQPKKSLYLCIIL